MWQGRNAVGGLTKLFEHFVALVQNEVFDFGGVQGLVPNKRIETSRGGDHNVRAFCLLAEELGVLGDGSTTEESVNADLWNVLGEPGIFVLNLERQLASVTHHEDRDLAVHWLELL